MSSAPKLTIELVPSTCWYTNVRSNVSNTEWNNIRQHCYMKANYKCEVCGGQGKKWPVECHEIWKYDDINKIQKLITLIALCPACHEVKHIGLSELRGKLSKSIRHLAKVNNWSAEEAKEYIDLQFIVWLDRSKHTWKLDISALDDYINKKETW